MARQDVPSVENSFVKGLVTASTGLSFPENAVASTDNCIYDFLGTVQRREGFNLEVGNVSKTATYTGAAISSFLWHNVLGDGSLNIYVVQVGSLLYFYPLSTTGAALSAQLVSAPLDITTVSAAANQTTFIPANATPSIGKIGNLTSGGGLNAAFDGVTVQTLANSAELVNATASTTNRAFVGQNYGVAGQKIGSVVVYSPSDGPGMGTVTTNYNDHDCNYTCSGSSCVLNSCGDSTFTTPATFTTTINLRAKNGTAPASANDAGSTILATGTYTGQPLTLNSNNTGSTFQYVWIEVLQTVTASNIPSDVALTNPPYGPNPFIQHTHAYSVNSYTYTFGVAEFTLFNPFSIATSPQIPLNECQYANGLGYLFVAHPYCLPFVVTYTAGNPATYAATGIVIRVRDFDGVNDNLQDGDSIKTEPSSLVGTYPQANQHLYNLYNQGWTSTQIGTVSPAAGWQGAFGNTYPSNCQVWWQLKNSSGVFTPTNKTLIDFGSSKAPNGRFIYDAFYLDRGTNIPSGAASLGVTHSNFNRPATVAFYAGRVFYGGVNYPNFANSIWFTQTLSPTDSNIISSFGRCHQINDPTAETLFDLLPTDGGVIKIPDCGQIYKLFVMQHILLVFASNGIWAISGSKGTAGLGFAANDYTVSKISNVRQLSGTSFVDVLGVPYWWVNEGIYTIKADQQGIRAVNITYSTINPTYEAILRNSKVYARGAYNPIDYTVQWLYRSTAPTTTPDDNYKFDKVLVYNTATNAFYTWSISTGNVNVASIVVTDTGGETDVSPTNVTYTFKYLVTYRVSGVQKINIADNFDTRYLDWYSYDSTGQSYTSTFTSGYKLKGNAMRRWQNNYVIVYSDNTVNTAYKIQGVWDYGIHGNSALWTTAQVITNTAYQGTVFRRHRIRGRGLVMQFRVQSYSTNPFHILGWGVWDTTNASP